MKTHAGGFTLIELMVVVVIIGILAAIALPQYNDYLLQGKVAEAASLLTDLQTREEQYYADNRVYAALTPRGGASASYPTTSCTTTGQTYLCTADGSSIGLGKFTVTETGTKATVTPPAGWTAPATNCWVRNKSGGC